MSSRNRDRDRDREEADQPTTDVWGDAQTADVQSMSLDFKLREDRIGGMLCALALECAGEIEKGGGCPIEPYVFAQLALHRLNGIGHLHAICHEIQPTISRPFADQTAMLRQLVLASGSDN